MGSYDFRSLSPADFEELIRDLLQADLRVRLECFSAGRDRGIDLRYAPTPDRQLIVQCKHYARSGYTALKRVLENEELPKIRRLSPARYVLCTSVDMTPGRKDDLLQLLRPFCRSTSDILGGSDINNLLARHSDVETQHHKLWLTSVAVLQRVLNSKAFLHTDLERTAISRRLSLYVQTPAFEKAIDLLQKHSYCIISGIPGIGKTTLAEILIVSLLDSGFDLVVATSSIGEALDLFQRDRRQVIYYDDFLGRSSLGEKLGKNEDRSLIRLIKEIKRTRSKLVLTTREYILAQARQAYGRLADSDIEVAKCILELGDYTRYDRARILYNHLHFFDVPRSHVEALVGGMTYKRIVDHQNFSPRIIEWMTTAIPDKRRPSDYTTEFLAMLDHPERLWAHAFDSDLTDDARLLLFILGSMPTPCPVSCVRLNFLASVPDPQAPAAGGRRFVKALKEVDGTFVLTTRSRGYLFVDFHNPSISDTIRKMIGSDVSLCEELIERAGYFEQLHHLVRMNSDGRLGKAATGLVNNVPLIVATVERLLESESCSVVVFQMSSGHIMQQQREIFLGSRLLQVCGWASTLNSTILHRCVLEQARAVCGSDLAKQSVLSLCDLLRAVDASASAAKEEVDDLVDSVALTITRQLDGLALDDWEAWVGVLEIASERFSADQLDAFREAAKLFCAAEPDVLFDNASSLDEAVAWADTLRSVASWCSPELEQELAYLDDSIAERFQESDEDDGEPIRRHRSSLPAGDDRAIEDLFASLRR